MNTSIMDNYTLQYSAFNEANDNVRELAKSYLMYTVGKLVTLYGINYKHKDAF